MIFLNQNYFKKPLASILVFCLIGLSTGLIWFYPKETNAQCIVNVATSGTGLKHIGLAQGWEALKASVLKGNLLETAISAAKLSWQAAKQYATWIKNVLLNLLLHTLLAKLSNDIVAWINTGKFPSHGLGDYLGNVADVAGVNFLDQYLGAGWLCEPFDVNIKIPLLAVDSFEVKARCTFDEIGHNLREFYDDFTKGGWQGWIKVAEPQHNFYGISLMAKDEYNRVKTEAKENADKEAAMGNGFLSVQECAWYAGTIKVYGPTEVIGQPALPNVCKPVNPPDPANPGMTQGGFQGPCHSECQTKTPGSVVSNIANKAITNTFDKYNAQIAGAVSGTGPFAVYITPIINALINKVLKEGLAFITGGEDEPQRGDLGAGVDLPEVLSPEKAMKDKDSVQLLSRNLNSLKKNIQDNLLQAQQENAAVLARIRSVYNETIPILNNVVANCAGLSSGFSLFGGGANYQDYVAWAQEKLTEINSTTPALDQRINEMALKISNTNLLITNIGDAENLALNYDIQAQNWLNIYEKVQGAEENQELKNAELSLKTAETDLTRKTQEVVQGINNTVASADIEGLSQEIQDSIIAVITDANNLNAERGNDQWPEAGTLYGELDEAGALKSTASARNNQCIQKQSSGSSSAF